jgi:hypothetical protein
VAWSRGQSGRGSEARCGPGLSARRRIIGSRLGGKR